MNEKPRAIGPGLVSGVLSRGRSVLGYDRGLALAPVEPVIDAEPDGLDPLVGIDPHQSVMTPGLIERLVPEVVVIEFGEDRPIRRNRIFDAAADGPPASILRRLKAVGRTEILIDKRPLFPNPSAAAPDVQHRPRKPAGEPQTPGDARQPVGVHLDRLTYRDSSPGAQSVVRADKIRASEIPLNAQHPIARELIIAADLAAE